MIPKVALLWSGDRSATPVSLDDHRLNGVARALRQVGVEVEPAVYSDDSADEVHEQLLAVDGVLVWVNPIENGRDRSALDAMLRRVAGEGVFVSAHPDAILKMGTKEVLYTTREMAWGCDTHLYETAEQFRVELPTRLRAGRPRVLKQYRGNGGNGVWKVELVSDSVVRVRHALRGSVERTLAIDEFLVTCEQYFTGTGRIIDQAYQERLVDGMVRCYLVQDEVVGFGHQAINALFPAPPAAAPSEAPAPGPRLYHPPTKPEFQDLKHELEQRWVSEMASAVGLDLDALPLLWDADFLFGPKTPKGDDTHVLCEINVSSVFPFPDAALEPLARATRDRVLAAKRARAARR